MLKETLNKFLILNGVQAAMVIQENGEIIESMKSGIQISETTKDVLSLFMKDSDEIAKNQANAPLSMVFVEFSDNFLILGPLIEEFFLLVIARNTANIGQITFEMKKNKESIISLL